MEIQKALDQITEIHEHLAKSDVYRGYRAIPVALSGVLALVAAAVQPAILAMFSDDKDSLMLFGYPLYWVAVAILAALIAGGGIVYSYLLEKSAIARRRTRITVGQLLPSIAAGIILTVMMLCWVKITFLLPGLWAIVFSLGIFASRPYLPKNIGWVALYYLIAGAILLKPIIPINEDSWVSPWRMGLTFGIGQILAGIVLYWNLERNHVR